MIERVNAFGPAESANLREASGGVCYVPRREMHAPVSGLAVIALVAATTCGRGNDPRNYNSPLCEAFAQYRSDRFDRCVPPSLLISVGQVQGSDPSSAFSDPLSTVCGVPPESSLRSESRPVPVDFQIESSDLLTLRTRSRFAIVTSLSDIDALLSSRERMAWNSGTRETLMQLQQCRQRLCSREAWIVRSMVQAVVLSPSDAMARDAAAGTSLTPVIVRVIEAAPLFPQFCAQSIVPDGGASSAPSRYCGASAIECPPYFGCESGRCVHNLRRAWVADQFPRMPVTPWQFGYRDSAGGFPGFAAFDAYAEHRGNLSRFASALGLNPNVRYWPRPQIGPDGENPNSVAFHPGPSGQWSIVRFVPPVAGQYRFDLRLDSPTATTTVRVDWFPSASPSTPRSISLDVVPAVVAARQLLINTNANSAVDFAVGTPNNDFSSDTTNISLEAEFVSPLE